MKVAAVIVTRGDQDTMPVIESLPKKWEILIVNNGWHGPEGGVIVRYHPPDREGLMRSVVVADIPDLAVYGRYAAIEYTDADLIYVQDDDCVVSDPQAIVDYAESAHEKYDGQPFVVCNMPQEFRHSFYEEHALVGFGACFHRDAPQRAFQKFEYDIGGQGAVSVLAMDADARQRFYRTCDIVFTALTPRVLVDVPHKNLPWAYRYDRMYRQPELLAERVRMLDLVRELR